MDLDIDVVRASLDGDGGLQAAEVAGAAVASAAEASPAALQDVVDAAVAALPDEAKKDAAQAAVAAVPTEDRRDVAQAAVAAVPREERGDLARSVVEGLDPAQLAQLRRETFPQDSGDRMWVFIVGFLVAGAVVVALSITAAVAKGETGSSIILLGTAFTSGILGGLLGAMKTGG